jgi:hypothetical protein
MSEKPAEAPLADAANLATAERSAQEVQRKGRIRPSAASRSEEKHVFVTNAGGLA